MKNSSFVPSDKIIDINNLEAIFFDSIVPACCKYECEVEPDGHCKHGNPSVLLDLGW